MRARATRADRGWVGWTQESSSKRTPTASARASRRGAPNHHPSGPVPARNAASRRRGTLRIVAVPRAPGVLRTSAAVTSASRDPNPGSSVATATTRIAPARPTPTADAPAAARDRPSPQPPDQRRRREGVRTEGCKASATVNAHPRPGTSTASATSPEQPRARDCCLRRDAAVGGPEFGPPYDGRLLTGDPRARGVAPPRRTQWQKRRGDLSRSRSLAVKRQPAFVCQRH